MLRRYSSRRASLYEEFLKPRLTGATRYDRIAGYFQSSLLELASEDLARIPQVRIVWNTEVSAEDVQTVRMASGAHRKELEEEITAIVGVVPDFIVDQWVTDRLENRAWDENAVLTLITERQQNPFTRKETTESLAADWDATAEVLNQIEVYRQLLGGW